MRKIFSILLVVCFTFACSSFCFAAEPTASEPSESLFITNSGVVYTIPDSGISLYWMDCDGLGHRHGSSTYYQHGKTLVNGEYVPATGVYCSWCNGLMDVIVGVWL